MKAHMSDFADEVKEIAEEVFGRGEFSHYTTYQERILRRLATGHLDEIENKVRVERLQVSEAEETQRNEWQIKGRRAMLREIVLVLATAILITAFMFMVFMPAVDLTARFGVNPKNGWISTYREDLEVWLVVGSAFFGLASIGQLLRRNGARRLSMMPIKLARGVYERALASATQDAVASSINDELGPEGIVAFPTHAPRLVELDTSQVTPSRTANYIKEFILEHDSSAIGLAGTRGSGKSTVMRALRGDRELSELVTVVPSPVRYDPGEFVRRLLCETAKTIASGSGRQTRPQKLLRITHTARPVMAAASLFALVLWWLSLGNLLVFIGAPLLLFATSTTGVRVALRFSDSKLRPDVRRSRELLQHLKWEVERGATTKVTVKMKSFFESAGERTVKLKSRALSQADMVTELRELLTLFANHNPKGRLIICIDELDKIDSSEHLIDIVNELKDLFHVQQIHFLVAVSTDALESFEKRGLSSRDAFDSAFDAIVHTDRLTLDESLSVVTSRAAGFAPLIAMFCHAWSGGLARDLLRTARAAVELQRRSTEGPLSVHQIVEHVILADLTAAIRASMRSLSPDDKQIDSLWELQQTLDRARTSPDPTQEPAAEGPKLAFDTPALQVLQAKVKLGLVLIQLAWVSRSKPTDWNTPSGTVKSLRQRLAYIAIAMSEIAGPLPVREEAITGVTAMLAPKSPDPDDRQVDIPIQ